MAKKESSQNNIAEDNNKNMDNSVINSNKNIENSVINKNKEDYGMYDNADDFHKSLYNPDALNDSGDIEEKNKNTNIEEEERQKFGILEYQEEEEEQQKNDNSNKESETKSKRIVNYLGKDTEIDPSEENDLIQMGLNYKRKQEEFAQREAQYNAYLENERRILEFTGAKDFNELNVLIENQKIQEEARRIADENGVSEEYALRLAKVESEQRNKDRQLEELRRQQAIFNVQQENNLLRQQFASDKHFNKISPIVDKMIIQVPNLKYDSAYWLVKGKMADELTSSDNQQNTSSAIANMQDRSIYKNTNINSNNKNSYDIDNHELEEIDKISMAFGNSSKSSKNSIRQYVSKMMKRK